MEHVLAVADGLADYDLELQIAAMLHDAVEDGEGITLESLRGDGVSERALAVLALVSNNLHAGMPYAEVIARIVRRRGDATLVKIADNAHNSRPDRGRCSGCADREIPDDEVRRGASGAVCAVPSEDGPDRGPSCAGPAVDGTGAGFTRPAGRLISHRVEVHAGASISASMASQARTSGTGLSFMQPRRSRLR